MLMSLSIITATVAIIVAIITFGQWLNGRNQLKLALFEKRYAAYEKISSYLASTLQNGRVEIGADIQFLRDTKRAYYLFAADPEIKALISAIYKKSVSLHALQEEQKSFSGDELSSNIEKQRVIKEWFESSLNNMEALFEKYLKLEH